MADIFLSYSSKHRDLTGALAQALEAEGLSVWWDTELEAYAIFRRPDRCGTFPIARDCIDLVGVRRCK